MMRAYENENIIDPYEVFNDAVQYAWGKVAQSYDVFSCQPENEILFDEIEWSEPIQAAQALLVNMLGEVMEKVSRFSPWYKKPARAFGLTALPRLTDQRTYWMLAPEAVQRWQPILQILAETIRMNSGLLQATLFVDQLMFEPEEDDPFIVAGCRCEPQQKIRLRRSVMARAELTCETCKHTFA